MKLFAALVFAATTAALVTPASAGDGDEFLGFYRGVFESAGSLDSISIVPNPAGGYRILLHATRYRRCEGPDPSAIAFADGTVRDGVMYRTNAGATCNGDGSTANWGEGEMSLSRDGELLTWTTPNGRQVYYHRVSD